jgi:endonuclease YncB( thermonuclease family)
MKCKIPLDPRKHQYSTQRLADKKPFEALVLSVCDGDTLQVCREWQFTSFEPDITKRSFHALDIEFIRLAAIDAPELKSLDARPALWAQIYLDGVCCRRIVTVRPRRIWRDLYHRIIATVECDGLDLGTCLIAAGHARPKTF